MIPPADCITCAGNTRWENLAPRERIAVDEYWRVAHAFGVSVPGWLVLVPRRHVTAIADLTDVEASTLGSWQVRLSRVLHEVTRCSKTYVAQFAEAEGFSHVHFHLIPRPPDLPADLRGPKIFNLLNQDGALTDTDRDKWAIRLQRRLTDQADP